MGGSLDQWRLAGLGYPAGFRAWSVLRVYVHRFIERDVRAGHEIGDGRRRSGVEWSRL